MNHIIDTTIARSQLLEPASVSNLSVHPLHDPQALEAPAYLTLDEALGAGTFSVAELSEGGSVPELKVINGADQPVLMLDGEELVGAKQNRVLNVSVLVAAKSELVVPVSCVEQGRWSNGHSGFESRQRSMYSRGRAEKMVHVSESMRVSGRRASNQGAVWQDIAAKSQRMGVDSRTGAMEDIYLAHEQRLRAYREIPRPEAVSGAVFCIDGTPVGLELFDSIATFRKLFPKLLDSYAMDALENPEPADRVADEKAITQLLGWVRDTPTEVFDAVGLGRDLRMDSPRVVGGGLEYEDRLIQLSAFQRRIGQPTGTGGPRSRMAAASRRRRSH